MKKLYSVLLIVALGFAQTSFAGLVQSIFARPSTNNQLFQAIEAGYLGAVRAALQSGAPVNAREESVAGTHYTPLHVAARSGRADIVCALLGAGAEIESRCFDQMTPLHMAVECGQLDVVNALLQAGADKEAKKNNQRTPLLCATHRDRQEEMVRALLQAGASKDARGSGQETSLHGAALWNSPEAVDLLLKAGANVHARDTRHYTPLHCAAHLCQTPERQLAVVRLLLQAGSDITARDAHNQTAADIARGANNEEVAQLIERWGHVVETWAQIPPPAAQQQMAEDPPPYEAVALNDGANSQH